MAITVGIRHHTRYRFDRPVRLSPHDIRLRPAPHTRTPISHYHLGIEPAGHRVHWQQDPFGNVLARVYFPEPVEELVVDVQLHADLTVINPFDFFVEKYAEHFPFRYDARLAHDLEPYLEVRENGPLLDRWLRGVDRRSRHIVDFLVLVNQRLQQDIGYTVRMEPGIQSCETTLEKAIGSCRDTGWLLVQILRRLGLAARFVSGYLVQLRPDQESLDGPSGPREDFTDLHAWTEVYVPGAGWIGLDPTSGLFAGEGHIPLACTPDPVSAAPVTGFTDPCEVSFEFSNSVTRHHEDPRVTYPYDDAQWDAVRRLGRQIDRELEEMDVRLTMGGEPTFISIDDMEGAEWNTEALGVEKRIRAGALLRRLRDAFAPGGLLLYGQGKWYPGEPLPRWALGCFWRQDGQALWRRTELQADERRDYGFGTEHARRFITALARRLGASTGHITPGYEDWLYYLWRDANTPRDLSPVALDWAPQFRDDLSLAMNRGLGTVTGFALPLEHDGSTWASGRWRFPRGQLYLIPGASPMGLRLPVANLPPGPPRTALCVEPRRGRLYVFLPPMDGLPAYQTLVTAIEETAAELDMPVLLEGFDPPGGALNSFKVTPDPGVIEVNIHPSTSWDALEHTVVTLYEEARQSRLGTEKFMVDGRHTGTGGGNHVTLGGNSTADSPFLRRPDLLRSFLTYWQHHPSLSYLFSGLFIGATSQAPRVDERGTRFVRLLDQALRLISPETTPWELDRTLRSCLTDITGNTHRAEFSIDKLYSADSPTGRLGLLEFRAFEMPPHARMSLAQMLLLRAMVARFWREPYQGDLVLWGSDLHDRFLLPHFVWQDFAEVIADLNRAGYPMQLGWFDAFREFRFPVCGRASYEGVDLELRQALEPWPVVESRNARQRTSRAVDSSVERLQLHCTGLDPDRYRVTCNGRLIPLQPTGDDGGHVAGIRFKAWAAPMGLHPTLASHAPLVFDLVDKRLERSVGGFVYHVSHPGGRSYGTFPVNAYEAEARRITRFWSWGHSAGEPPARHRPATASHWPPPDEQPDGPRLYTLDLRRVTT